MAVGFVYAIYIKFIKYLSAIFCCALWFSISKFIANAQFFYDVIIFFFLLYFAPTIATIITSIWIALSSRMRPFIKKNRTLIPQLFYKYIVRDGWRKKRQHQHSITLLCMQMSCKKDAQESERKQIWRKFMIWFLLFENLMLGFFLFF